MLWIGMGGVLGAITRYLMGKWIASHTAFVHFPFGTWVINVSGSFILGLLAVFHLHRIIPEWLWFLIGVGFLGAYTTFSTFGYETNLMLQRNKKAYAAFYVLASVLLGLLFAWIGGLAAMAMV